VADLDDILVFVKVAQFESITRAARSLGMPISTVSRRLSVLESALGVSLLRRTTRRVMLTAQGREYFSQCQEPLSHFCAETVDSHTGPCVLCQVSLNGVFINGKIAYRDQHHLATPFAETLEPAVEKAVLREAGS